MNWQFTKRLAVVALASLGFIGTAVAADADKAKKVLFIGIDGCRFDAVKVAKTPNLDRLMEEGCYDEDCQALGDRYIGNDTISGPGWSSILTGVWADKHGVLDNKFAVSHFDQYPHFFVRLKKTRPDAKTASFTSWPQIHRHIEASADVANRFPIVPKNDYRSADEAAAKTTAKLLANDDPTAVFVYLGHVDETGHKKGFHPSVPEYVEAIEQVDAHVGTIVEALAARKKRDAEDWLVIVTSDHGGKGTDHTKGHKDPDVLNSFLIVSGESAQRGKLDEITYIVDASATALAHLGVPIDPKWQLDGRPVGLEGVEAAVKN